MKRSKYWIATICLLLFCAAVLFSVSLQKNRRTNVIAYIQENHLALESFVEDILNTGTAPSEYNDWDVTYFPESGMIQFDVKKGGFGASTTYEGFYYSLEDVPRGFQGTDIEFQCNGIRWEWHDSNNDNFAYTEQIIDNWYWFEMHF